MHGNCPAVTGFSTFHLPNISIALENLITSTLIRNKLYQKKSSLQTPQNVKGRLVAKRRQIY